jgi:hypothetical protein
MCVFYAYHPHLFDNLIIQSVPGNSEPISKHTTAVVCVVTHFLVVRSLLLQHAIVRGSTLSKTICGYLVNTLA